jgi:hypothetical protein
VYRRPVKWHHQGRVVAAWGACRHEGDQGSVDTASDVIMPRIAIGQLPDRNPSEGHNWIRSDELTSIVCLKGSTQEREAVYE